MLFLGIIKCAILAWVTTYETNRVAVLLQMGLYAFTLFVYYSSVRDFGTI